MFDSLIVQPIFNILVIIYSVVPGADLGITLVIFTIVIRFALYPLLKKQLHQSRAMQKLQPELKKIQAQYKDNRQMQGVAMMELYKKYNVSPWRSIGILLIQLPIFFGLFSVIKIFAEQPDQIGKWTYDFLEGLPAVHNLIQNPGSLSHVAFGFIDLNKTAVQNGQIYWPLMIIALIGAGTQYIMSKQIMPKNVPKRKLRDIMSEAADGKKHDQSDMNQAVSNNMMKFMPIMMFFIMISLPGAIALYYVVSNMVAVAQQAYILKEDEEEMEEIASEPTAEKTTGKNQRAAEARARAAKEAHVTRIVAKDSGRRNK